MFRRLHRYAGVIASVILIVISLTGAILSIYPMIEADRSTNRLDAGQLVAAVSQTVPGVEQITVDDNGQMTAVAFGDAGFAQYRIDPETGAVLGDIETGSVELWFEDLHRALFLDDTGRMVVMGVTGAIIVLSLSGYVLAARRMGGWRRLFDRDHGAGAGGLHLRVARIAGVGLLISSVSGLWMAMATLGVVPDTSPVAPWPTGVSTSVANAPETLAALTAIDGDSLRAISIPRADLTGQAYMVETDAGAGYVDPVTGQMLTWADRGLAAKAMDIVHLLHTGQGASVLGLVLGLASLSAPLLAGSGVLVWLRGRAGRRRLRGASASEADVVLLVGSEGGTTWSFAAALHRALESAGKKVHAAPMGAFAPDSYTNAQAIVVFAATYGEGDAPAGAKGFLDELAGLASAPKAPLAVLGFGDTSFPLFCAYADQVTQAARAKGWALMVRPGTVDRQSSRDFADWAEGFGKVLGVPNLGAAADTLDRQRTHALRLTQIRTYGEAAQAPTAVLRFAIPRRSLSDLIMGRGFSRFQAGDLLNILPPGDDRARSYSLASGRRDGFVEICVRKQPGGLCSGALFGMQVGDEIQGWLTPNPRFHAPVGDAPVILIGAGAGVGALAGMARANKEHRRMHLYFGTRQRQGGYPYQGDFDSWLQDGRLSALTMAFSRGQRAQYVQHAVAEDAGRIADLIADGARIMVCGGRNMAEGVREALEAALAPKGLALATLRAEGRYVEDVF